MHVLAGEWVGAWLEMSLTFLVAAIGVAGLEPLEDYRGVTDRRGRPLNVTIIAVADQLAAAAGLLMRKPDGAPVVLIRGCDWRASEGSARTLLRRPEQDLFR